jgi:hypothetical protein
MRRTAVDLVGRIRRRFARVYVLVADDSVDQLRARAVCSCKKWRAPNRSEVCAATDDAFRHSCDSGHRMATPRVRAIRGARGALMTRPDRDDRVRGELTSSDMAGPGYSRFRDWPNVLIPSDFEMTPKTPSMQHLPRKGAPNVRSAHTSGGREGR